MQNCNGCGHRTPMGQLVMGYCKSCEHRIGEKRDYVPSVKLESKTPPRVSCTQCGKLCKSGLCRSCQPRKKYERARKLIPCTQCGKFCKGELCRDCKRKRGKKCQCGNRIKPTSTFCRVCRKNERIEKRNARPDCPNPTNSKRCKGKSTEKNEYGLCNYCLVLYYAKYNPKGTCEVCGVPCKTTHCKKHVDTNKVVGKCRECDGVYTQRSKGDLCVRCRKNHTRRKHAHRKLSKIKQ